MFDTITNWWTGVKAWFKNSETIFLARAEVVVGFMIAVVGAMDWSPLLTFDISSGFDTTQLLVVGGMIIVKGVISEIARRRNATDL